MNFLSDRLKEPSTWRGIIILLTLFGINIDPDQQAAIITAGGSVFALINIFRKER